MKRTLTMLICAACLVAAAVVPAVALAHRGHHRHGRDQRVTGTVASFDKGVLTIKKADGTTVTGDVTGRTEVECENENEDQNDNEDKAGDSRAHASHDGGGDDNSQENEAEDQNENDTNNCDNTQLTPGAVVSRARLRDRHNHTFWKQLKLAL